MVGLEMGIQSSDYPKSLVPNKAGIEPHFGCEKFRSGSWTESLYVLPWGVGSGTITFTY